VLTSGGDRIFPKGLLIGYVRDVKTGADLFLRIHVRLSANLSKVEEVLVITKVDEREPSAAELNAPVRAIDILANRLPSVPEKPATDQPKPAVGTPKTSAASGVKPSGAAPELKSSAKPKPEITNGTTGAVVSATSPVPKSKPASATSTTPRPKVKPATENPATGIGSAAVNAGESDTTRTPANSYSTPAVSAPAQTAPGAADPPATSSQPPQGHRR